ncbi:MAG: CHAT domain-containing protein [Okeania sp. SIO2C9]|uniref:CHAT domain-containing protein n=1 Tax=Okeania sp. SIO2C9 TaxID=2607791 RepID=UPI0013C015FF|nr:CHAT domain-containing tetratricopeptide repeat protein [Okeania sp. SIO2C9]NEQ77341.1 CHAT domain-containing protein [Okeania sp. SIO2C9]
MEEEFIDLINQLLVCNNFQEVNEVLGSNQQLIVPELLPVMVEAAEALAKNNNPDGANFILNLTLQLGEFLGSSQMAPTTRKETADVLFEIGIRWFQISVFPLALQCWQQTLTIYQEIKDRQGEAISLGNLGIAYDSLGQSERAIEFFQQSLAIARETKYRQGEANSLGCLGNAYNSLGQYEQAIDFYQQSVAIKREIKDRQGEANSLNDLGFAYVSLGQSERAIEFHQQSLAIAREIKYLQGEANSLGCLGIVYFFLGQYERAIEFQQQYLAIAREIKDRQEETYSLVNLGSAYHSLGQYERAIEFFQQSLAIAREIKDRQGEAYSLGNLGNAYNSLGQYEQAIEKHQQYLAIAREIKDRKGEAISLSNLGNAYNSLGQYEQAIEKHQQSLAIQQEIKDRRGEGYSLGNLGIAYHSLGQYEQAIKFHQQSLDIKREIKDCQGEAISLGNLGNAYNSLEQYDRAIPNFQKSLKIATPKTMPVECASLAGNLGYLHFTQGKWEKAISAYTQAIEATEILRTGRQTENSRQEVLKNAISVYTNIIQCFVNTKQHAQALTYAEQSRNRQLVDLMYGKDVYYQEETPPEVAELSQQYEKIQLQIDNLRFNNESRNYNQELVGAANSRKISASWQARNDRITTLEAEKQVIYRQIRKLDPVLAEGLAVTPLEFAKLQNLVQDNPTTALVSFFTTDEDTYAFILVGDNVDLHRCGQGYGELQIWLRENWFQSYVLSGLPESDRPPLSTIAAAKLLGCEIDTIESAKPEKETVSIFLKDGTTQSVDKAKFKKLRKQLLSIYDWHQKMPSNLKEISQRLQLDKLVEKLTGIEELIIIPHLYLHQIPFAALPLADNQYLGDKFLIRTQSSCQTLDFCTQRPPISTETPAYGIVEDTQEDLPCSSFEAQKVAQIYNVATDKYLQGTTATVSTYKQLLQQVQGLLSSHHAKSRFDNSLESELILADGRITLSDLLSPAFRFPDLDEVFLSCCETNLGTTEITDDTMTLNTGFLCAGARGVISSLWAVDDLATSLFSLFYHQKRKAGLNRPQALQKAQQDLRQLTGEEFEREYYRELEQLLNEKLQLASQKKAAAKQKLDGCAEDAPEYQQLQAEYKKQVSLEKRILRTRDIRLKAVCEQEHPFEHPEYWSGFICAGLR